jgi:hypothetical protein
MAIGAEPTLMVRRNRPLRASSMRTVVLLMSPMKTCAVQ